MLNLNDRIIDIVEKYPIIDKFLLKNNITCSSCRLGSCKLKDIFEIHSYSKKDQEAMIDYAIKLVSNQVSELKVFKQEESTKTLSIVIKELMSEHLVIVDMINLTEYLTRQDNMLAIYGRDVRKLISYYQSFAFDYHHSNEEEMLFKYFNDNDAVISMLEEHNESRRYAYLLGEAKTEKEIKKALMDFATMLEEHAYKEDNIVFPYLNNILKEEDLNDSISILHKKDTKLKDEVRKFIDDFNNRLFV